ncbi:putative ABC transporter ATP-binding protein [Nocardia brasiliensis NBRC 14402]|nr:multidrug ABC transporter ATP-binding protein [Nocardia brasiliensis]GAJ80181.1 putative ABC transporter ATP-binding protein [Nocardia brasiliensis NBRC 14402]SUB47630.1 Fluoroquinolones export ATP-binding protein Rv2688c/MT2762 [Nocardia brasiliensis]
MWVAAEAAYGREVIEARGLTKAYGRTVAVRDGGFTVAPGRVTGFLGPNGSGKTTTLRMILGLATPSSGEVRVAGKRYCELVRPLHVVGALLDAGDVLASRTAVAHLRVLAAANGIRRSRVDEVLGAVGLAEVAGRRVGEFSLGMRQRLGIAAALLGDPAIVVLDEPVNGLDTEGIRWIRGLLRSMADQGRTVLLSSHVMSEMQLVADHLLVIGAGTLLADEPMTRFIERHADPVVRVRAAELPVLVETIGAEARVELHGDSAVVHGISSRAIGRLAARNGIVLDELTPIHASVEDVFTGLVEQHQQFAHGAAGRAA